MKFPLFIPLLFLLLFAEFGHAQTVSNPQDPPHIEVTGIAEQEVIPDEIYLSIILREKFNNKEKISIQAQEEKLKKQLLAVGIDLSLLSLSDANADLIKIRWKNSGVLTQKEYTLQLSTATQVGQVFQQLDKLEITDASIQRVNHSKLDSLKKQVKINAIKAAKAKADYLLNAIGEQTGKALIVQEYDNQYFPKSDANYYPSRLMAESGLAEATLPEGDNDLQFSKIKIEARIFVKFAIK